MDTAFAHDPPEFRLQLLNEFHALVVAVAKIIAARNLVVRVVPWPVSLMTRTLYIATTTPVSCVTLPWQPRKRISSFFPFPASTAIEAPQKMPRPLQRTPVKKRSIIAAFSPAKWCWPTTRGSRSTFLRALLVFAPPVTPPMPASPRPSRGRQQQSLPVTAAHRGCR